MTKDKHTHQFKPKESATLVHAYDGQRKKQGASTATDILKQFSCKCGKVVTYDLERRLG
jgi:hypothetical protein